LIVAWAVLDLTQSRTAAVVASVLTCTSVPLLDIYTQLWSEPTFFIWELLSLWSLARYARGRRKRDLYVAGVATGLAMLTRYAGLSLLLTGIVVLSSLRYWSIFERLRVAVLFSALAALPCGLWILRNTLSAHSATGRTVAYHPLGTARSQGAFTTIGLWLAPLHLPAPIGLWWLGVAAVAAGIAGWHSIRSRAIVITGDIWGIVVVAIFLIVYFGFLIVSVSTATPGVHFNDRIFAPALVATIVGLVLIGHALSRAAPTSNLMGVVIVIVACMIAANSARLARTEVVRVSSAHAPFQARWRTSPLIRAVKALPSGVVIYSNLPGQLFLMTGRPVLALPSRQLPNREGPNLNYARQLADVRREVLQGHLVVADFTGRLARHTTRRGLWSAPEELSRALGLTIVSGGKGDALLAVR
jgi:hypothetical protein